MQVAEFVVATVFENDLESAGGPQSFDRRGAEDIDQPAFDFRLKILLEPVGDRVGRESLAGRSWKSLSMMYIAPKFGALAPNRIDWPAMARCG